MNFNFSQTIIRKIYLKRFCRRSRMASCVGKFSLFARQICVFLEIGQTKKLETWSENRLFIELNIAIEDLCEKSATKMISPFEGHRTFVFK